MIYNIYLMIPRVYFKQWKFILINIFLVDCQWKWWSVWSPCSATCGRGIRRRHRSLLVKQAGKGSPCVGKSSRKRKCNSGSCATTTTEKPESKLLNYSISRLSIIDKIYVKLRFTLYLAYPVFYCSTLWLGKSKGGGQIEFFRDITWIKYKL